MSKCSIPSPSPPSPCCHVYYLLLKMGLNFRNLAVDTHHLFPSSCNGYHCEIVCKNQLHIFGAAILYFKRSQRPILKTSWQHDDLRLKAVAPKLCSGKEEREVDGGRCRGCRKKARPPPHLCFRYRNHPQSQWRQRHTSPTSRDTDLVVSYTQPAPSGVASHEGNHNPVLDLSPNNHSNDGIFVDRSDGSWRHIQ